MKTLAFRVLLLILLVGSAAPISAQLPTPSPAAPLFQERPFGPRPAPDSDAPDRVQTDAETPIPFRWILGGLAVAALVIALILWGSARRWHSSNLFDRQYRFPSVKEPALRLGGKKSGGHLVRVQFEQARLPNEQSSKAKDA